MTPPTFLFLSKRYGLENPSTWNCETGKVSSSLVSVMIKISNIQFTRTFSSIKFVRERVNVKVAYDDVIYMFNSSFFILEKESASISELVPK